MTFSKFLVIQPIHDMQLDWKRITGILTIAIGDGGNELGMGKVHEEIITTIPEGDLIGKLDSTSSSTSSWRVLSNDKGLVRRNKIIFQLHLFQPCIFSRVVSQIGVVGHFNLLLEFFKVILKPELTFLRKITKMITRVNFRGFNEFTLCMIFAIFLKMVISIILWFGYFCEKNWKSYIII